MENNRELVYLSGELVPLTEARVSVLDYNFLFGYGLFETMHAYNGNVFRLEKHLDRLLKSATKLRINVDRDNIRKAVTSVVKANESAESRVRLIVSPGAGNLIADITSCKQPLIVAFATKHVPLKPEIYERGFRVIIASNCRNTTSAVAGMKVTGYIENILARREARARGADDAIIFNEEGNLAEASMSNVFIVKNGIVMTPPLTAGILPGITRDAILEIAPAMGINTQEKDISLTQLMDADEVFLTASMLEIMPVTIIDSRQIGTGKSGPITKKLMEGYQSLIKKETSASNWT